MILYFGVSPLAIWALFTHPRIITKMFALDMIVNLNGLIKLLLALFIGALEVHTIKVRDRGRTTYRQKIILAYIVAFT